MGVWRDGEPWGWYVNLQEPFRCSERAVGTMDLMLDLLIAQDGSWRLKDEQELTTLVAAGVVDAATERRVRVEAQRVTELAARGEPPFSEPWHAWRPDPEGRPPVLPSDWAVPLVRTRRPPAG